MSSVKPTCLRQHNASTGVMNKLSLIEIMEPQVVEIMEPLFDRFLPLPVPQ